MIIGRIAARKSPIAGRKAAPPIARLSVPDDSDMRVERAGRHSKQHFKNIAADDQKWERFATSLTGKTADERSPEQNKALGQLRKEVLSGDVSPRYASNGSGNGSGLISTKPGHSGVYVPSQGPSDGDVILPSTLRRTALQKASNDRFGEAIANRATELGIDVSGGNVAAGSGPPGLADIQSETTAVLDGEDSGAALFEAVTGISFDDLTAEQAILLEIILQNTLNGRKFPTVVIAGADSGLTLPAGVNAAYVPEKNLIILRPGLTQTEQKAALREEFGEFLASEAGKAGIPVGPGDAGARVRKVLAGEKADPSDYVDNETDSGTVVVFGNKEDAQFQTAPATTGVAGRADTIDMLAAADTDGNGALSENELATIEGISPEQAKVLTRLYGVPTNIGEFVIPVGSSAFVGVGIETMVDEGVVTMTETGGQQKATTVLSNASNSTIAHALVRYAGFQRFMNTPTEERGAAGVSSFIQDAYTTGITAIEMDEATDAVLGDTKPLDGKNGHRDALYSDFKGPNSSGGLTVSDLNDMLDTGALYIKRDPTNSSASFIGFSAHRGMRPTIGTGTDFANYVMKFDANGDGVIDFNEFKSALDTYYGADNVSTYEAGLLFDIFSSFEPGEGRALTQTDVEAMFDEGAFLLTATGDLLTRTASVEPKRIQTALFSRVAEQRGISEDGVVFVTSLELSDAAGALFGSPLDMSGDIRGYGTVNFAGQIYYSADMITAALSDNVVILYADGKLIAVNRHGAHVPDPQRGTQSPDAEYTVANADHYGSANYGTGFQQGDHSVSNGQIHLNEGSSAFGVRTTLYVPPEAFAPNGNVSKVVNPLEIKSHGFTLIGINRVAPSDMVRTDNGDGTATWTIHGLDTVVATGSEIDTYLTDYQAFSDADAVVNSGPMVGQSNHLEHRPNLELSQSHVDQNGDTIQVWVPRSNQFRTNSDGHGVPIESAPVVSVNGEVIQPSRMFVGSSPVDGQEIIGFEYQDLISGGVKTSFMVVDSSTPQQKRGLAQLTQSFSDSGNAVAHNTVMADPTDTAHNPLMAFLEGLGPLESAAPTGGYTAESLMEMSAEDAGDILASLPAPQAAFLLSQILDKPGGASFAAKALLRMDPARAGIVLGIMYYYRNPEEIPQTDVTASGRRLTQSGAKDDLLQAGIDPGPPDPALLAMLGELLGENPELAGEVAYHALNAVGVDIDAAHYDWGVDGDLDDVQVNAEVDALLDIFFENAPPELQAVGAEPFEGFVPLPEQPAGNATFGQTVEDELAALMQAPIDQVNDPNDTTNVLPIDPNEIYQGQIAHDAALALDLEYDFNIPPVVTGTPGAGPSTAGPSHAQAQTLGAASSAVVGNVATAEAEDAQIDNAVTQIQDLVTTAGPGSNQTALGLLFALTGGDLVKIKKILRRLPINLQGQFFKYVVNFQGHLQRLVDTRLEDPNFVTYRRQIAKFIVIGRNGFTVQYLLELPPEQAASILQRLGPERRTAMLKTIRLVSPEKYQAIAAVRRAHVGPGILDIWKPTDQEMATQKAETQWAKFEGHLQRYEQSFETPNPRKLMINLFTTLFGPPTAENIPNAILEIAKRLGPKAAAGMLHALIRMHDTVTGNVIISTVIDMTSTLGPEQTDVFLNSFFGYEKDGGLVKGLNKVALREYNTAPKIKTAVVATLADQVLAAGTPAQQAEALSSIGAPGLAAAVLAHIAQSTGVAAIAASILEALLKPHGPGSNPGLANQIINIASGAGPSSGSLSETTLAPEAAAALLSVIDQVRTPVGQKRPRP